MPDSGRTGAGGENDRSDPSAVTDPDIDHLFDRLEMLERTVDDPEEREQVRETMRVARRIPGSGTFGRTIDKYTSRDVAETFVGSILVSLPLLVEDGVFDIGEHFAETPPFFVANAAFVVLMTVGLLYWADLQEVKITRPILGVVPRRLVGVLSIAAATSTFTMTLWGRVDWSDPWTAVCSISVVWVASAFGGALGDILPGESKGEDISQDVPL